VYKLYFPRRDLYGYFGMTVLALYNRLSILSALFDHDVNVLFSSVKTIKWDVTNIAVPVSKIVFNMRS